VGEGKARKSKKHWTSQDGGTKRNYPRPSMAANGKISQRKTQKKKRGDTTAKQFLEGFLKTKGYWVLGVASNPKKSEDSTSHLANKSVPGGKTSPQDPHTGAQW